MLIWEGSELGWEGEGDKPRLTRDGPRGSMAVLGLKSIAQLMCFYTNACSVSNKLEELGAMVQQDSHSLPHRNVLGWLVPSVAMMVISSSEGTGEEAEAAGWLCTLGSVYSVQSQG